MPKKQPATVAETEPTPDPAAVIKIVAPSMQTAGTELAPTTVKRCRFCGHALTDPVSVAAGAGPVCSARFGVPRPQASRFSNRTGRATRTRNHATPRAQQNTEPSTQLILTVFETQEPTEPDDHTA